MTGSRSEEQQEKGKERKKVRKNRERARTGTRTGAGGRRGRDKKEKQSSRRAGSGSRKKKSPGSSSAERPERRERSGVVGQVAGTSSEQRARACDSLGREDQEREREREREWKSKQARKARQKMALINARKADRALLFCPRYPVRLQFEQIFAKGTEREQDKERWKKKR